LLDDNDLHLVCLDVWADYQNPQLRDEIVADHVAVAQMLRTLGGEILMTVPTHPGNGPRWGAQEFAAAAETLNEVGKRVLDLGIRNALHPHWGTYVETQDEIERILDATDPRYVFFAPDSGQIAKGDTDPVAMVRNYVERVAHVHLKDVSPKWPELRQMGVSLAMPEGYAELGQGIVDTRGFIQVLADANYDGWMMGELDKAADPKKSAEISKRFLIEEMGFAI
jgi:inosose dehydratase